MIKPLNNSLVTSLYPQRSNTPLTANPGNNSASFKYPESYANISFGGITKLMKKRTYVDGQKDIQKIVEEHKDRSLIVGQLPHFMIEKLPKENRKECIKEIYDTFDRITEELRNFDETKVSTIEEIQKRRNNSTKELFENLMRKYNFVSRWDDVDIEYLGKGGKGAGYKLVGLKDPSKNEDEFVIKVYHQLAGENWHYFKSHGAYAEINSAAYWMENVGYETQRGKFFFGSLKSGYMFSKYVDDDVRLPKKNLDPYHYGLKCTDENAGYKHNVCKGYSFDWGGVRVINRTKNSSKTSRYVGYRIKNIEEKYRISEWGRIYRSRKMDQSQKNAGLAISIKHLPHKEYYINKMLELNDPVVDRGLAYVLKYLNYSTAIKYFEKLVQTKDVLTQVILFNEIPLLAMKHRDLQIKDDLQTLRSEIQPGRIKAYYDIAEKYALPESIEHLASFVHLLPREDFREYYRNLAKIKNDDLHERLIYKLSNVRHQDLFFAMKNLAENVDDDMLKKRLLSSADNLCDDEKAKIENIINKRSE